MNGGGFGGGFGGGPPRFGARPGMPALGPFAFGAPDPHTAPMPGSGQPGRNSSPLSLAVNRGKAVGPFADPECPSYLIASITKWHNGKKVGRPGEAPLVLEWRAMELIDMGPEGGIVHPWEYLDPSTDDVELANEVWDKIKTRSRLYDDGLAHTFQLKCYFAHEESAHTSWEGCDVLCQFPRENASFGATGAAQANALFRGGRPGMPGAMGMHGAPHLAMQEIQAMELAFHVMREANGMIMATARDAQNALQAHQNRELEVMKLVSELSTNKRQQEREDKMYEMKMMALMNAMEKFAPLAQHVGLKLTQAIYSKLMTKKPKSDKEMKAYELIKMIVKSAEAKGIEDPNKIWIMLKNFGVTDTEENKEILSNILFEVVADLSGEKAEKEVEKSIGHALMGGNGQPAPKQMTPAPTPAQATTPTTNTEK